MKKPIKASTRVAHALESLPHRSSFSGTLVQEGLFEYPFADNGKPALLANRCITCGTTFFPKRLLCPACFEQGTMEDIKLGRRGILYACTVIHRDSPAGITAPYAYGYVEIPANQVRVFGLLTGSDPSSFHSGQEVKLVIEPVKTDPEGRQVIGYKFKPVS